jgi:hypothetical protein
MRLPRVRFTVRAMMAAVAATAIPCWGFATYPVLTLVACFFGAPLAVATWSGIRYIRYR